MFWPAALAARSQAAMSTTDRARIPMPAAWTALFDQSALKNEAAGSSIGSPTYWRRDGAVDDRGQRPVAGQAVGEAGQAALAVDPDEEELSVAHDPGAELDGHRELVQDRRGADPDDPVDVGHGHALDGRRHAVRYPSSHMMVWPVTSSEASLARKMAAPMSSRGRPSRGRSMRALMKSAVSDVAARPGA